MKNPPPKNSRWKLKETGELHLVILSDEEEVTTIAVNHSWHGAISDFYEQFSKV